MAEADIPGVMRIADEIHRDLPEHECVFRERLQLFPHGCMVLASSSEPGRPETEQIGGYVVSFPIRRGKPPALNERLGGDSITDEADQYYLHDLAIQPTFRGRGAAAEVVGKVLDVAKQWTSVCLISVYGTVPFWEKFGLVSAEEVDGAMQKKLGGYGPGATFMVRNERE